ncbi:MAG: histidine phosphatase family protein [Alphaproteobacteria bacterium]|nr:histidine phosphatase family protein [Alphaproteobacteria bacterium]
MPALLLLRHAKSDWADASLADHDRPLAPRGERAALAMGQYMRQRGLCPDLVLCSSARRACDTYELVASRLDGAPDVLVERELYLAGSSALLARLRRVPAGIAALMLVAHNPDLQQLAQALAGQGAEELLLAVRAGFPTAALAVLAVPGWNKLAPDSATLSLFRAPRQLLCSRPIKTRRPNWRGPSGRAATPLRRRPSAT